MTALAVHPDLATLNAFALGRLPEYRRGDVEAHVANCPECGRALEAANPDSLLDLARRAVMSTPAPAGGETLGPATETPPELLDHPRYKVLGKLGAGGMGVVYKAEHRVMGRLVALKVLSSRTTAKSGAVDRFRREVRIASKLSHPNVVTAHDADEAGGLHFLVMEYVDGVSLDRLLALKGELPVTMVCHFIRQAALGLQHAFEKGMIHRDVKPQNIMVTRKGAVKVLDFGLACVARDGDELTSATAAKVTSPDMVMGTPDFLAPEQAKCSPDVDIRADLYGLGGTLCYLLTGQPPFPGGTAFEKLMAHVGDPPPDISTRRPAIPAALAAVVSKLLAKEPNDRYATPAEVAAALLPFTKATPSVSLVPVLDAEVVPAVVEAPAFEVLDEEPATPKKRKAKRRPVPFYKKYQSKLIAAGVLLALLAVGGVAANRLGGNGDEGSGAKPASGPGTAKNAAVVSPKASPPTVLMVLAPTELYLPDYTPVRSELERSGVRVQTASMSRTPCVPYSGTPGPSVSPDLAIGDVDPTKYDGVIFIGSGVWPYVPGGNGATDVRRIIGSLREQGKIVAAICHGARVLQQHGVLGNWTDKKFEESGVVRKGQIITGGTATDAIPFAKEVASAVKK